MKLKISIRYRTLVFIIAIFFTGVSLYAQTTDPSLPHLVHENGRYALIVDGHF